MARRLSVLLGLLGFGLAGLTLGIFVSRGYGFIRGPGPVPRLVGGYVFGVALIAGALIVRIRPGVGKSIVLLAGIGTFAALLAFGGFIASAAIHFE
ncbi:hypothetical protein ACQPYK_48650 (plasmid) [Streptosporangium sp. CA-135522]|uniref:hypothetical protein n=1 Tax=Streptosporangium sp. CA-135522 TaxID=3240072 RepID=UPI003D8E8F3A